MERVEHEDKTNIGSKKNIEGNMESPTVDSSTNSDNWPFNLARLRMWNVDASFIVVRWRGGMIYPHDTITNKTSR